MGGNPGRIVRTPSAWSRPTRNNRPAGPRHEVIRCRAQKPSSESKSQRVQVTEHQCVRRAVHPNARASVFQSFRCLWDGTPRCANQQHTVVTALIQANLHETSCNARLFLPVGQRGCASHPGRLRPLALVPPSASLSSLPRVVRDGAQRRFRRNDAKVLGFSPRTRFDAPASATSSIN